MDPYFSDLSDLTNGFNSKFGDDLILPGFNLPTLPENEFKLGDDSTNLRLMDFPSLTTSPELNDFAPSSSVTSETIDSLDEHDSDPVLKYLNQILLEENIEDRLCMFQDPVALKASEKSLYEVLGEQYPPSPYPPHLGQNVESPDNSFGSFNGYITNISSSSNSTDTMCTRNPGEYRSLESENKHLDNSALCTNPKSSFDSVYNTNGNIDGSMGSSLVTPVIPNICADSESILQFKRGVEEASKFLPTGNQLILNLDQYKLPMRSKEMASYVVVRAENDEKDNSSSFSKGRKHNYSDDVDVEEGRSRKQSAVSVDEINLSEMFDRLLLCTDEKGEPVCCDDELLSSGADLVSQQNGDHGLNGRKIRSKRTGNEKEVVDLRALLISCAQSVAADDRRTAYQQLKQIRHHSCPKGDASQRVAHVFANGLEARMAGTGTRLYEALAFQRISAVQQLKAYQVYLSVCPFDKISIFFAMKMIYRAALEATTLHVVDFGISYGFQWPLLIQFLSSRLGGPPTLRITGIEFPQPGFRPAERVEETGHRLAKYCKRFKVPFEYHAVATQKWETIKIEDLNIRRGEVLAVNCLFRFRNLLDETVLVDSPRDSVLRMIRSMNPDIFVNAIINGSYSVPFFVTRFREALFHYSAVFDMFDDTLSREDHERMHLEEQCYGREVMNVVACEGSERVERPEKYKQWQVRAARAGFKSLPLNKELINASRGKLRAGYHHDFVLVEDGHWMLLGWKGRVICGSSCWVPN